MHAEFRCGLCRTLRRVRNSQHDRAIHSSMHSCVVLCNFTRFIMYINPSSIHFVPHFECTRALLLWTRHRRVDHETDLIESRGQYYPEHQPPPTTSSKVSTHHPTTTATEVFRISRGTFESLYGQPLLSGLSGHHRS